MSTTYQIVNSANEVIFSYTFVADGMLGLYETGVGVTLLVLLLFFTCHALFRFWKLFVEYINGEEIDSFDDSCIFDSWFNAGTNPWGILLDHILWTVVSVCCAFIWVLYWPVFLITTIAKYIRAKRMQAKQIMNTLAGEPRY